MRWKTSEEAGEEYLEEKEKGMGWKTSEEAGEEYLEEKEKGIADMSAKKEKEIKQIVDKLNKMLENKEIDIAEIEACGSRLLYIGVSSGYIRRH